MDASSYISIQFTNNAYDKFLVRFETHNPYTNFILIHEKITFLMNSENPEKEIPSPPMSSTPSLVNTRKGYHKGTNFHRPKGNIHRRSRGRIRNNR